MCIYIFIAADNWVQYYSVYALSFMVIVSICVYICTYRFFTLCVCTMCVDSSSKAQFSRKFWTRSLRCAPPKLHTHTHTHIHTYIYTHTYTYTLQWGFLLQGAILAQILDAFSEMRATKTARLAALGNACFVCGMERHLFAHDGGFEEHVAHYHDAWSYFAYGMCVCVYVCECMYGLSFVGI